MNHPPGALTPTYTFSDARTKDISRRVALVLAAVLFFAVPEPSHAAETGSVSGVVVYERDADRPWRLGRYYIRRAKSGELAEAVVAISQRGLKVERTRPPVESVVDQKDHLFTPEVSAIQAGDSVRFLNSDTSLHNVQTTHPLQSFNVTIPPEGGHVETFTRGGGIRRPYVIGCAFHSSMRAWVYVFDHPWFALTGEDGKFELTEIPPGEYPLEVVHPAGALRAQRTLVVKAGETTEIELRLSPDDLTTGD